jgi:hypothetical protein
VFTIAEVKDFLTAAQVRVRPPTAAQRAVTHEARPA